jgi:hypothetical protein
MVKIKILPPMTRKSLIKGRVDRSRNREKCIASVEASELPSGKIEDEFKQLDSDASIVHASTPQRRRGKSGRSSVTKLLRAWRNKSFNQDDHTDNGEFLIKDCTPVSQIRPRNSQ